MALLNHATPAYISCAAPAAVRYEQDRAPDVWGQWATWGDQGNGTYVNPVLPADFSDLDCIRVGKDYYAISSTMQFSPGMVILHSKDLVNWSIIGHAVSDLTQIGPALNWDRMDRYGRGIWAGAIRFHDGKFWIYFGTPDEGYFMTTASNPAGPWTPLHPVLQEAGWDDCCPFWDDDGQAYLVATHFRDGYTTYLFKLTQDGRSLVKEGGVVINRGAGREANKLYKINGWYYHFYSEDRGAVGRVVMMQRAKSILGPYVEKRQLTDGNREAHEPNQGGLVQATNGHWYFFTHHGTMDWEGRPASLLPVTWVGGWPVPGFVGADGLGAMAWSGDKPVPKSKICAPQTSDDFEKSVLGTQWEWNYQPRADRWSLTERPGFLRLHAFPPRRKDDLRAAGNTLTQRSFRTSGNDAIVKLDLRGMADGQKAGLCHFSAESYCALGVKHDEATHTLVWNENSRIILGPVLAGNEVWLRSQWGQDGISRFSYSLDGNHFTEFGDSYRLAGTAYRGDRIGVYSYNDQVDAGYIDVDFFHYRFDGPGSHGKASR